MISVNDRIRILFGLKLRQLRQDRGLQAAELAERAGLSASYLTEIERGRKYPKPEKLFALATALGTDYDTLVSVRLDKRLEPLAELLDSNILAELPLDLFGIEPTDLFELLGQAPARVSAFISTLIEIGRNYGMNVEQFHFSALRSYQELHNNSFDDIEQVAATFITMQTGRADGQLGETDLHRVLTEQYGYQIETFSEADQPLLAGLRSVVVPGSPTVLLVNRLLEPQQRAFTYGREIGFQVMKLSSRPLVSAQMEAESFEQVLNNFRASYFAGAVLISRSRLTAGLAGFFAQSTWQPQLLTDLLATFDATAEMFMHRISSVMPSHFGVDQLFFLRFDQAPPDGRFVLAKELHLARLHNPHGTVNEHYCHRWVSLTLLQDLNRQQQTGTYTDATLCGAQVSQYVNSGNQYLLLTLAKPSPPRTGYNSSVSVGFAVDDTLRRVVRFLDDPDLVRRQVNETCERCALMDCHERVAPPVVWQRQQRTEQVKARLAQLQATYHPGA